MTGNEQGIETVRRISAAVGVWASTQFGAGAEAYQLEHCLLGMLEEVGELTHAVLKMQQGIRGTPEEHKEAIQDAVADICIFLADLMERVRLDYGTAYSQALIRPRDTAIQLPENLRAACFTLSTFVGKLRDGLILRRPTGGSIYDQLTVILWTCDSLTYALVGEPLWQIMERVWCQAVSKRDWKANPHSGKSEVIDDPSVYEHESGRRVAVGAAVEQEAEKTSATLAGAVVTGLLDGKSQELDADLTVTRSDAEFATEKTDGGCTPIVPEDSPALPKLIVVDPVAGTVTPVSELKPAPATPLEEANRCIREVCAELAGFLITKNTSYGNAAFEPMTVFSAGSPLDRIRVRIDDKLGRILRGRAFPGDNDKDDLLGYLMLERAVTRFQQPTLFRQPAADQ